MREIYNPYEKYGLRRVVNASSSLTRLGGSIAPPEVFRAMEDASKSFVQIPELQHWAGKAIAEATGAEAGLPTAGSSNAILLAAAACIMKGTELEKYDPLKLETWTHIIKKLPMHTKGLKTEFIVQRSNRNVYDHAVECAGGRFVEVGTEEGTTEKELSEAYNPGKTAAYYFTDRTSEKRLPLATVIRIAHEHDAPVIVDAASELPPKKNLRKYISKGADLVIISGGKFLSGPNNSGILAGRKDLVKLAHLQAYPFHGVGRASKMCRETIAGLVTALKIYVKQDEESIFRAWENKAKWMVEQMDVIPDVEAGLSFETTIEEKEPMVPLCYVKIDENVFGMTGEELFHKLREGDPSIETRYRASSGRLMINPEFMLDDEEYIVTERIREILTQAIGG